MTTFESQQTQVKKSPEELYHFFSDLTNLGKYKDRIPEDKIKDLEYTSDGFSFSVSPVGRIAFKISEQVPYESVGFVAENAPVPFNFQVKFSPEAEDGTSDFRIIANADINPFLKPMISKPLQDAIDKMAETFALVMDQKI